MCESSGACYDRRNNFTQIFSVLYIIIIIDNCYITATIISDKDKLKNRILVSLCLARSLDQFLCIVLDVARITTRFPSKATAPAIKHIHCITITPRYKETLFQKISHVYLKFMNPPKKYVRTSKQTGKLN